MWFSGTADIGFTKHSAWMARTEIGTEGDCWKAQWLSGGVEIHWHGWEQMEGMVESGAVTVYDVNITHEQGRVSIKRRAPMVGVVLRCWGLLMVNVVTIVHITLNERAPVANTLHEFPLLRLAGTAPAQIMWNGSQMSCSITAFHSKTFARR